MATSSPVEMVVPEMRIKRLEPQSNATSNSLTEIDVTKGSRADLAAQAIFISYSELHRELLYDGGPTGQLSPVSLLLVRLLSG